MAKKGLLVLALVSILAGGVWAQESWGGDKNFVSTELGLLVGGLRYERILSPALSVGANLYWANSFIIFNEMELGVFARYYLWKGFFGELGLGFHIHTGVEDGVEYTYAGATYTADGAVTNTGLAISPGLGWKFDPGNAGGFFVEPGIIVPITIGEKTLWLSYVDGEIGVSIGFLVYCGLGWAF